MIEDPIPFHEYANIIPFMSSDEYVELKQDIEINGLLEPIVLFDGQILDGRNRYNCCRELGIEPTFEEYKGSNPLQYVISLNLKRRHLTSSQRACISLEVLPILERQAKERQGTRTDLSGHSGKNTVMLDLGEAREKAADLFNTNSRYVSDAKKIKDISPLLFQQILQGQKTLTEATKQLKEEGQKVLIRATQQLKEEATTYPVIFINSPLFHSPTILNELTINNTPDSVLFMLSMNERLSMNLDFIKKNGFNYRFTILIEHHNEYKFLLVATTGKETAEHINIRVSGEEPTTLINGFYPDKQKIAFFTTIPLNNLWEVVDNDIDFVYQEEAETIKDMVIENINYLQTLDVRTYTLYQKWQQLQTLEPFDIDTIQQVRNSLYQSTDINQYRTIKPKLIFCSNDIDNKRWLILRHYISADKYYQPLGRNIRFIVIDENNLNILGILELSSDFNNLPPRDRYIGWQPTKRPYLKNILNLSTCVSVQPFSFNTLGVKLMTLLATSEEVQDTYKECYGNRLLGITTTSLYGNGSVYTTLKQFKNCGSTSGEIPLELSKGVWDIQRQWFRKYHLDEYEDTVNASHPKLTQQRIANRLMGVDIPALKHKRGCYFCSLYQNTLSLLRGVDIEVGETAFVRDIPSLTNIWLEMANKRTKRLQEEGRISTKGLWYENFHTINWTDVIS